MEATSDTPENRNASPAGIFGIGLGFLILLGCVSLLFFYGSRTFASSEPLERRFDLRATPGGPTLQEQAFLLPGGERVYVLSDGTPIESPAEIEATLAAEDVPTTEVDASSSTSETKAFKPYDWAGIDVLSDDSPPSRIFLVNFPAGRAETLIRQQFQSLNWKDLSTIEAKGGRTTVEGGDLRWAGYAADFVRERQFIEGGSFKDTARVNLSLGGECWIAYAMWPTSHAGSKEAVEAWLRGLQPLE